jgi:RNA polymerase sigma factor (sigma-70 family)
MSCAVTSAGAHQPIGLPWPSAPRPRGLLVRLLSQIRRAGHLSRAALGRAAPAPPLADDAAFEQLYFTLADPLLVTLARKIADPETARDLWAETWARAYESRGRFRGRTRPEQEAWIRGIARHLLASYYRRGDVHARALRRVELERPAMSERDHDRVERAAALDAVRYELGEALDQLPAPQREAIELRILQQLPYGEVATRTGASEQTVRARVSRGLKTLRGSVDPGLVDFDHGDWV